MSDTLAQPTIQLLVFEGCPLADAARHELQSALTELGLERYEEIDLLSADAPDNLRGWGSPTILIDGHDVAGASKGNDIGCRVYTGAEKVPTAGDIMAAIMETS